MGCCAECEKSGGDCGAWAPRTAPSRGVGKQWGTPTTAGSSGTKSIAIRAGSTLKAGQTLAVGGVLWSPDGRFYATLQSDGNFVIYDTSIVVDGNYLPIFASNTSGSGATVLSMQTDGNLVLYTPNWTAVWSTRTRGSGAAYAILQSGGNFELLTASGGAVWDTFQITPEEILWMIVNNSATPPGPTSASGFVGAYAPPRTVNTGGGGTSSIAFRTDVLMRGDSLSPGEGLFSQSGCFLAAFQTDGNFVVYDLRNGTLTVVVMTVNIDFAADYGPALFASNTAGAGARLNFQGADGNVVIYDASGRALWATGTNGQPATRLIMQNDGNLVLYGSGDDALWSSFSHMSPPIPAGVDLSKIPVNGQTCAQMTSGGFTERRVTAPRRAAAGSGASGGGLPSRVVSSSSSSSSSSGGGLPPRAVPASSARRMNASKRGVGLPAPKQTGGYGLSLSELFGEGTCLMALAAALPLLGADLCTAAGQPVIEGFQVAWNDQFPDSPISESGAYDGPTANALAQLLPKNATIPAQCSKVLRGG